MISIQNYIRAQSLEEAWQLNQKRRNRVIGGMLWLKLGKGSIQTAVDLCDLGLNQIEEDENQFSIGAMVSLRQLEMHEGLNRYACGAVRNAVKDIVGVQFRNMATVGGSIFSRFGFSDVLTMFMAMDCDVELFKGGIVPLAEFARMKRDRDILIRLIVKKTPGKFAYQSMRNQKTDFPVIACAVSQLGGKYRAVIGARPSRAMLVSDENKLAKDAAAFAEYVSEHVPVGSNVRAGAAYRKHLVKVLTQRALTEIGGME